MQAQAHRQGSAHKRDTAGGTGTGSTVGHDRQTAPSSLSHGGSCEASRACLRGKDHETNSSTSESVGVGIALCGSGEPSSGAVTTDGVARQTAYAHIEPGIEQCHAEAEATARDLQQQCVVTDAVAVSSLAHEHCCAHVPACAL